MRAQLFFEIRLPWDNTTYSALQDITIEEYYDKQEKEYVWRFLLSHYSKVVQIIGKPIEFSAEIIPKEIRDIILQQEYGVSRVEIEVIGPKLFRLHEWRRGREIVHDVPLENVAIIWEIIREYAQGTYIKGTTIQEHICENIPLPRFFRESRTFDKEKFFGTRIAYMAYYYRPIKILEFYGFVRYTKTGLVANNKGDIDFTFTQPKKKDVFYDAY